MPSQADDALDETKAKANKGGDNEHQEQGICSDDSNEITDPADSRSNESGNDRNDTFHGYLLSPLQTDNALDEADTETHEGGNNEHQEQRVFDDDGHELTNPADSGGDEGVNNIDNRGNGGSSLKNQSFLFLI